MSTVLERFSPRHLPALTFASGMVFGSTMSFINGKSAVEAYGLREPVSTSKQAHTVMMLYASRSTVIGLSMFAFYFKGQFAAVDTILTMLSCHAVVDAYVCWKERVPQKAISRFLMTAFAAGWGYWGMTAGQ